MKKGLRLLALLLLFCLLPVGLLACGGDDDETTTIKRPEGVTVDPKWDSVDLSDVHLYIGYNEVVSGNVSDTGAGNSAIYLIGPDENGDHSRGDYKAAYERHALVCSVLGLSRGKNGNLTYTETGWGGTDDTLKIIQDYNAADMDNTPNIIIHQNYGMVRGGILGEFYNAYEDEYTNYFDLTHEGWYLDMMEENSLSKDKIYMLMGDYFIDQFRFACGVLVNTSMIDQILRFEDGMDGLYEIVNSGNWTYDEFKRIASLGYTPGSTGESLVMGAVGQSSWVARTFFASSGLDIFQRDANGTPSYISDSTAISAWLDQMLAMQRESYFEHAWDLNIQLNSNRDTAAKTFINGGAVFAMHQMILSFEGSNILDMDSPASIVPTPKYIPVGGTNDGSTDYRALTTDHAGSGGILISADPEQFTAATAFLQLMTEQSEEFFTQYYENGLKHRDNEAGIGHIDMLDLIHAGICSPMSFLYDNYCAKSLSLDSYGSIMRDILTNGSNTFTSSWSSELSAKQNRWSYLAANFGTAAAGTLQ